MTGSPFLARLASGSALLLDGATGTELQRRGVDTRLPLWSARALLEVPAVLHAVHADYIASGADIITTNTFRTHRRTLTRAGLGERTRMPRGLPFATNPSRRCILRDPCNIT